MVGHRVTGAQRGVVLLLALVALLLISAVGAAILYMAAAESGFVGAQKLSARTFYADTAALEEGRYRMIPAIPDAEGGLNNTDLLNALDNTQGFALLPAIPLPGNPPQEVLYIINTANPASPANFNVAPLAPGAVVGAPVRGMNDPNGPPNDPLRASEVPNAVGLGVRAVASLQPAAGNPNQSVTWEWVRLNLKTELAASQDLDFSGGLDQDPVFVYLGRQYRATNLQNMDPTVLPPPWGPDPTTVVPPIVDRPCVAVICASPVYMLTALASIPQLETTTYRLARAEVAVVPAFSINAAILSQPGIDVNGNLLVSGRDLCDPDCANLQPDLNGDPATPDNIFAGQANFAQRPSSSVPAACTAMTPLQSQAGPAANQPKNAAAQSDPSCAEPPCVCKNNTCILPSITSPYDVNELISMLRPSATTVLPGGTICTGCRLGTFPVADPINGAGADPQITYVAGDFTLNTTASSGAGILIVDGNLNWRAGAYFYGVILVRGSVSFLGGGSPPVPCHIYGALLTGGPVAAATDIGGIYCFQYNTCAQRNNFSGTPLMTLSFREIPQ